MSPASMVPAIEMLSICAVVPSVAVAELEKEILEFIINGLKPELISEELIISIQTVRTHVRNIHRKLKCNRTEEIILKYRV